MSPPQNDEPTEGCGTSCGAGLEKVYPRTAVRYGAMGRIGEFDYRRGTVFKCGAKVVISTDRGIELGEQVSLTCNGCEQSVSREQMRRYIQTSGPEFCRLNSGRILREATPQDINEHTRLNGHNCEDVQRAESLATEQKLDMKIVTVEHLLGGERIVFYFRADTRIDFRDLVRELAGQYQTRIEMRQVGARDEARLVADVEICGRECCCKNFLKKLRPVTMKMAKLQKSTLDPTKVSGRCGRLRCCLRYEHIGYEELAAKLPRIGTTVDTEFGRAAVIDRQILTQLVLVRTEDQRRVTIPIEEVQVVPRSKPGSPDRSAEAEPRRAAQDPPPAEKPAPQESAPADQRRDPGDRPRETSETSAPNDADRRSSNANENNNDNAQRGRRRRRRRGPRRGRSGEPPAAENK